jgi:hypothetical protein
MNRCLARLGALPQRVVWDREGAIHAGGGRPAAEYAAYFAAHAASPTLRPLTTQPKPPRPSPTKRQRTYEPEH